MQREEEITLTLPLDETYYVDNIDIDEQNKVIIVEVKDKKSQNLCPDCKVHSQVYDHIQKKWRHTDFSNYKVYINYRNPRIKCQDHGVKLACVSWAKPRHAFTVSMEELMVQLSEKYPLVKVGQIVDEHDTRIRRIVNKIKKEENDRN